MNFPPNRNNYAEKAVNLRKVELQVQNVRERLRSNLPVSLEEVDFADTFYLHSSDPLAKLNESLEDLSGQSVLTVAGSGEFTEVFLNKGAGHVEVFDVSLPGLLFNELRLAVLRRCDFDTYRKLFDSEEVSLERSLFNRLKSSLSPEARAYFGGLLGDESESIRLSDVGRYRSSRSFIGKTISSEDDYSRLQKMARKATVTSHLEDISSKAQEKSPHDLTYLSNVPELMIDYNLVRDFIRNGSKRVIFTLWAVESEMEGKVELVSDEGTFLLKPGDTFKMGGMNARLLGFDKMVPFSALVEFRAEDNPALIGQS